ncbi:MAG: 6,7-dimethyl-8-ribityllumazine synthase [Verrucomicrobiales bacterium]
MSQSTLPPRPRAIGAQQNISIIASLYNDDYVGPMLRATQEELAQVLTDATLPVFRVPGAYEIPVCAEYLARNSNPDVIVALGVIIRGETAHADLVAQSVADALQRIALDHVIPVINEVLLVDNAEQAAERCLGTRINRGIEAARAAAGMAEMFQKLKQAYPGQLTDG